VEDTQFELEAKIYGLSSERLLELAERFDIQVVESRRPAITRCIVAGIAKLVEKSPKKMEFLAEIGDFINGNPPPLDTSEVSGVSSDSVSGKKPSQKVSIDVGKVLKKDFKIHGVVGADSTKDSLTFISIMRQIDTGLTTGYSEHEIIEAVIRAVSVNSRLRPYLELVSDLSLTRLKQILRVHFKQKSCTELYQELSVLCQDVKETPQDFLIRAMNLRQQVILSSKQSEGAIKYDPLLVQALFVHVVETGLVDESVRAKLRPYLEMDGVTDEVLMEKVNVAVSAEAERFNKMNVSKKAVKVHQVTQNSHREGEGQSGVNAVANKNEKPNKLFATLEAVQADLAYLKGVVNQSRPRLDHNESNSAGQSQFRSSRFRLCRDCEEKGMDRCNHCYKCGSTTHFARGCRAERESENARRLQSRDNQ